jgi:hypothetical protein
MKEYSSELVTLLNIVVLSYYEGRRLYSYAVNELDIRNPTKK